MITPGDTHPNGIKWAEQKVKEHTETALYYINEGIDPEHALDMVRRETILSEQYFNQVVNNVFTQRITQL